MDIDFSYYTPINRRQKEFHQTKAPHKLLMGGMGSGKTYPAIHESLFTCLDNVRHEFYVFKNTYDHLSELIDEFLPICRDVGIFKEYSKSDKNLILINGTTIRFRPLSLGRDKLKGINCCGWFIDDPDISKYKEVIGFLYTRLRNKPRAKALYFQTIITANYEGHNWLWQKYCRNKEEGVVDKNGFVYWVCPTKDNPTLPENFISTLEGMHSKAWADRFLHCNMDRAYAGLIYDEWDKKIHTADLSWCFEDKNLLKILAIDSGINDPNVILNMATDGKKIYIYDEWYKPDRVDVLGHCLCRKKEREEFRDLVGDPSMNITDKTSGTSVNELLRKEFGLRIINGNNNIDYGIELGKTLFTIRDNNGRIVVDENRCENFCKEIELYQWNEPAMSDFDELAYKEKPVDRDNHAMDAARYGWCYLKKYMHGIFGKEREMEERRRKIKMERLNKLKFYKGKNVLSYDSQRMKDLYYKNRLTNGNKNANINIGRVDNEAFK